MTALFELPQRGWRTQPRGSTLGTAPRAFALKGRQLERTNNAKVGPIVALLNCALSFFAHNRCELYQVSLSPLQLQGEPFICRFPRVESLIFIHNFGGGRSASSDLPHARIRSPAAIIVAPGSTAQRCEQNTGWKPMLH